MAISESAVGPASLLKEGSSWLDPKAVFDEKDKALADAAASLWNVTRQLRAKQGERGYSNSMIGALATVRRQTVSDVLMGVVWPDTRTLGRICSVLGLELTTVEKV